ncbi:MAG: histidine phosphatase family protein [Lachnospiraceae bacterium]|nr:histidine phosphatase family protein [Lachnospiraceae bacterium]
MEENGNILIVSHGAILKAVIVALTHGKITYYDSGVSIAQGGISHIKYEGEQYAIKWIQV